MYLGVERLVIRLDSNMLVKPLVFVCAHCSSLDGMCADVDGTSTASWMVKASPLAVWCWSRASPSVSARPLGKGRRKLTAPTTVVVGLRLKSPAQPWVVQGEM